MSRMAPESDKNQASYEVSKLLMPLVISEQLGLIAETSSKKCDANTFNESVKPSHTYQLLSNWFDDVANLTFCHRHTIRQHEAKSPAFDIDGSDRGFHATIW